MSDTCPKCGADESDPVDECTAYECGSHWVMTLFGGAVAQGQPCRIRQLEGLLRRVLDDSHVICAEQGWEDEHVIDDQLFRELWKALEAPK